MLIGGYRALRAASSEVLNAHGYQVEECRTLSDASRRLRALSPALVVLDTLVGDGDPIEFVPNLRQSSTVPVIVRNFQREHEFGVKAFEAGADDYVGESCSYEELALRVQAILGRHGGNRVLASESVLR